MSTKNDDSPSVTIESLSAVTLATHDMGRAIRFYQSLGFKMLYGGGNAPLSSFAVGAGFLNLIAQPPDARWSWWGRVIFHVSDVDALYDRVRELGLKPSTEPRNAEWGERHFHLIDPDGHELSFAEPLSQFR